MKRLNRKLFLEARLRSDDGAGGFSGQWVQLGSHWGAVEPAAGRLERGEGQARSRSSYRVTLRAVSPTSEARPKPGQRFRDGARLFEIRTVRDSSDVRFLECFVDEEVAS
ncbi:MAG: head-tail adaptor protein [Pseudomonadota bacterium]